MTLRDQYAAGLAALGYSRDQTASKKFWVYSKSGASPAHFFLGSAGSVRFSHLKRIDASVPASDSTKQAIIKKGKQA